MNKKLTTKSGLVTVVLYLVVSIVVTLFTTIFFGHGEKTETLRVIEDFTDSSMIANIIVAVIVVLVTFFVFRDSTRDIFFEKTRARSSWFLALFPVVWAGMIIFYIYTADLSAYSVSNVLLLLAATLAIAVNEEIVSRGILLTGLRNDRQAEWKVWLFSTLVFAFMHLVNLIGGGNFTQVIVVFFGGTFFYIMRRIFGNLLVPILAHMLYDTAVVLMTGDFLVDAGLPDHILDIQLASVLILVLMVVLFLIFGRSLFKEPLPEKMETVES